MSIIDMKVRLLVTMMAMVVAALASAPIARAAAPIKLVQASTVGWEVDVSKGKICRITSGQCKSGTASSRAGGFTYPEGIAANPTNGDFYVADQGNHRVQEFNPAGEFILMFGMEVDATTKANICTAVSGDTCKAGVSGAGAGQFYAPQGITVEPDGDVYVSESINEGTAFPGRVQKFTAEGHFVLELGKEVNETTKRNLCTQKEVEEAGVKCGEPTIPTPGIDEHGAFAFSPGSSGNVLAYNENDGMVYVGEEDRVQEFETDGVWKDEVPAASKIKAIAVDGTTGDLYVVYESQNIVHEFDQEGEELASYEVHPREVGNGASIITLAVDSLGHVAASVYETGKGTTTYFGALYNSVTGLELPDFSIPEDAADVSGKDADVTGLGFTGTGELLAADAGHQEASIYLPVSVGELETGAATCKEGVEIETSVRLDCLLNGEVNPYGVASTETWFEWGRTCTLGSDTPREGIAVPGEVLLPVSATIEGVRPNEALCYRLAAVDENVQSPEQLVGKKVTFNTAIVPAKIAGAPIASFVTSSSAVMYGELNPENASTEYFFEYSAQLEPGERTLADCPGIKQAECPGVASTQVGDSSLYGRMGVTVEAAQLQPSTTYQFRLAAANEAGESTGKAVEQEGTFTTAPAPSVKAETGPPSQITSSSAVVSGIVDPNGQPASYTFELGIYQGSTTQFGIVFSGPTGSTIEAKTLPLTGLLPGTEYSYRIKIASGYGTATGVPVTFKTEGLPAALIAPSALPQLAVPRIAFPKSIISCKKGYTRRKQNKCVKTKIKVKKTKAKTKTKKMLVKKGRK